MLTDAPNAALPGVTVFPLSQGLEAGVPQRVLVEIDANGIIPLHVHEVDAKMIITGGSGRVLSSDGTHGTQVRPGHIVFFERQVPHGFEAGPSGLTFLSENGGIIDTRGAEAWDIDFCHGSNH